MRLSMLCAERLDNEMMDGNIIHLDDIKAMCEFNHIYMADDVVVCDMHFEDGSVCHTEFAPGWGDRIDGHEPLTLISPY